MTTKTETITNISLEKFVPFQDHPFQVRDDEQMQIITESIRSVGVLVPAIARPIENVQYELIAGHRRKQPVVKNFSSRNVGLRSYPRETTVLQKISFDRITSLQLLSERLPADVSRWIYSI